MHKLFAVAAVVAISAAGALAQRGMGRGPGHVPPAGARGPAAPKVPKVKNMPKQPAKIPNAQPKAANPQPKGVALQFTERHRARLGPMLPAGMPIEAAAEGFKNRGQFIAALQVSRNLGIPFEDLKLRMTGPDSQPLGRAIQELRPAMTPEEVTEAVAEAERQAMEQERDMAGEPAQVREQESAPPETGQPK